MARPLDWDAMVRILEAENAAHQRWLFAADMNGDGFVTIGDIWLWVKWVFCTPGDGVLLLVMTQAPALARFLEITPAASLGGWLSALISVATWMACLAVVGEIVEDLLWMLWVALLGVGVFAAAMAVKFLIGLPAGLLFVGMVFGGGGFAWWRWSRASFESKIARLEQEARDSERQWEAYEERDVRTAHAREAWEANWRRSPRKARLGP